MVSVVFLSIMVMLSLVTMVTCRWWRKKGWGEQSNSREEGKVCSDLCCYGAGLNILTGLILINDLRSAGFVNNKYTRWDHTIAKVTVAMAFIMSATCRITSDEF